MRSSRGGMTGDSSETVAMRQDAASTCGFRVDDSCYPGLNALGYRISPRWGWYRKQSDDWPQWPGGEGTDYVRCAHSVRSFPTQSVCYLCLRTLVTLDSGPNTRGGRGNIGGVAGKFCARYCEATILSAVPGHPTSKRTPWARGRSVPQLMVQVWRRM